MQSGNFTAVRTVTTGPRELNAPPMPSLPILFAPLALLVPLGLQGMDADAGKGVLDPVVAEQGRKDERRISPLPLSPEAPAWSPLFDGIEPATGEQVRIERRVILRVSPAPGNARQSLMAAPQPMRVVERKMGQCLDGANIGGVADRGNHLVMFLRDRRTVAARLEKGCSPRDFYRGFYMERSEDGKICAKRDRLMSRSGAKCQVASFSELVLEPVD